MSVSNGEVQRYVQANRSRFETELIQWLSIPSVSTLREFNHSTAKSARWIADKLQRLGLQADLIQTDRHPIVVAESAKVPAAPTVLVYGHYDVQPADPLDQWTTAPFEPSIRDGRIYARGASDDKGQLLTHVFSAEAWMKTVGSLPIQLKFVIEGEEECGSESLTKFLLGKYDSAGPTSVARLASDICVISDNRQYGPGRPAITYGLRGMAYFELHVQGPTRDLHSGAFGGSVANPAIALSQMLGALVNEKGQIQVPHFYDDVIPLTSRERRQFAELNFDNQEYQDQVGVSQLVGEEGFSTLERRWARPTCDIHGIWSGYQDEGVKTIVPSSAGAKFSFRLVPDQDPQRVYKLLDDFFGAICPAGVTMQLKDLYRTRGVLVPLDNPFMGAAAKAIEQGFGTPPVFIRGGGSIPVVNLVQDTLGINTLLLGWGQDSDNIHSPDENFLLKDFHHGISTSCCLWEHLSTVSSAQVP